MSRKKRKVKTKVKVLLFLSIVLIIGGCIGAKYSDFDFLKKTPKKIIQEQKKEEQLEEEKEKSYNLSLIMVGDALIHNSVFSDAITGSKFDFKPMLSEIKKTTSEYDLAFYNQETILGGTEIGLSNYPCFNSPYEVGDAFIDAGFNLVSLANNHTLDRGYAAIENSRKYWDKHEDIIATGSFTSQEQRDEVVIKEKNGIKYALLSYTTVDNGLIRPYGKEYTLNLYDPELVAKDIEKLRNQVDLLMVSMHWGSEYSYYVSQEQETISDYLSSLGVDIIIGHHAHVVEPIEYKGKTLVIYSLGNVLSGQIGVERLTGLVVALNINKKVEDGKSTITMSNPKAELIYTCKPDEGCRNGHKIYPYSKLNNSILYNYESYYKQFMDIVKSCSDRVEHLEMK